MTSNVNTSAPFPLAGKRALSPKEMLRRSQAQACTVPEENKPNCTGQVFLGMFFDGTGNNLNEDLKPHKQSNITRLFRVHEDNSEILGVAPPSYFRREYIPGVGTPFAQIGEPVGEKSGKAMANGGQSRIIWGLIQTLNALHRYAANGKPLISDEDAGKFAGGVGDGDPKKALAKIQSRILELKNTLQKTKPTIVQFNLSVFGFSRGAAQARVYCNWVYSLCEKHDDDYSLAGVPLRIYFLGIFDTVAAVGATGLDVFKDEIASGHAAWAKGNLRIPAAIERCVHFVASHEVRACFPLDSVRYKGKYPENCYEAVYPGVHSDIGGGYRPSTQGRSVLPENGNTYSFSSLIPCIDMYNQAMLSGVPLTPYNKMKPISSRDFTASSETISDYNAYINADKATGSVEKICRQRMNVYRLYRYKKIDSFVDDAIKQGCPRDDAKFLAITNDFFKLKCAEFKRKYANAVAITKKNELNKLGSTKGADDRTASEVKKSLLAKAFQQEDLEMWEGMHRVEILSDEIINFFDHYLHDSIAGFAQDGVLESQYNGRGHFRNRNIYDSGGE